MVEWNSDHRSPGHQRCPGSYGELERLVLGMVDTYPVALKFNIPASVSKSIPVYENSGMSSTCIRQRIKAESKGLYMGLSSGG